jgi:hypothetical protein
MPVRDVTKDRCVDWAQASGAVRLRSRWMPPQHPRGHKNVQSSEPGDGPANRRVQQVGSQYRIVDQEIICVPKAEPGQKHEKHPHLKQKKHPQDAEKTMSQRGSVRTVLRGRPAVRQRRDSQCSCRRLARNFFERSRSLRPTPGTLLNHTSEPG